MSDRKRHNTERDTHAGYDENQNYSRQANKHDGERHSRYHNTSRSISPAPHHAKKQEKGDSNHRSRSRSHNYDRSYQDAPRGRGRGRTTRGSKYNNPEKNRDHNQYEGRKSGDQKARDYSPYNDRYDNQRSDSSVEANDRKRGRR